MIEVIYFTKPLLKIVNEASIREERDMTIIPEIIDQLDDDTLFPVVDSEEIPSDMHYNLDAPDDSVRLWVMLAPESGASLDVSKKTFLNLPSTQLTMSVSIH